MLRHSIAALAAALLLAACGSAPGPSSGAAPTSPSAAVTPQPGAPPTTTPIPQPVAGTSANATATHNGQACDISAERATLTIRFYRGDADTARAVSAELQQMGEPLPDLAEDTPGLAAFGQNEQKAIMLRQTDDHIIVFGIVFGSQSQPRDHEQAHSNLDTLQNMAFVRYAAGQTEDLVMPTQMHPTTPSR